MLTITDYLDFEGRRAKNRMHLLFLFGETEGIDGLVQAKGRSRSLGKNLGHQGPSELQFPPKISSVVCLQVFSGPCIPQGPESI